MIDSLLFGVTLLAALGSAVMGGLLFAFSTFIMRALARLPPAHGIAAMQSINVAILTPLFLTVFLGTAAANGFLAVASLSRWSAPGAAHVLAGSLLYLVGTFLVTMVFNVPRNDALAAADATSPAGASLWTEYLRTWTAWNHVRTLAALAAATLLVLSMCVGPGERAGA